MLEKRGSTNVVLFALGFRPPRRPPPGPSPQLVATGHFHRSTARLVQHPELNPGPSKSPRMTIASMAPGSSAEHVIRDAPTASLPRFAPVGSRPEPNTGLTR